MTDTAKDEIDENLAKEFWESSERVVDQILD